MRSLKTLIVATMALGVLTLIGGFFSHLALTDIYHGEADTSLEWRVVQVSALVNLVFIGMTLFTLARAWKTPRGTLA